LDCETGRQDESQPVKIIANELIDRDSAAAKDKYAAFADEQAAWLAFAGELQGFVAAQTARGYKIRTVTLKIAELCSIVQLANTPEVIERGK
jgi:hypothetical protein